MGAVELNSTSLVSDANLVSYYRLEGNVNDEKGVSNGTSSGITFNSSNGKFNQGGGNSSGYIDLGSTASHALSTFSVGCWFKTNDTGTARIIIQKLSDDRGGWLGYGVAYNWASNNGKLHVRIQQSSAPSFIDFDSVATVNDNAWHHVCLTYDGTTAKLYIDGKLDSSATGGAVYWYSTVKPATVISDYASGTHSGGFAACADDAFIFSRVLSQGEVALLYDNRKFQVDTNNTLNKNLIAYYKLDDVNDFCLSNNLTNNNSVAFNTGKLGNAADGGSANTNKCLNKSTNLGIDGGNVTISAWVKITTAPSSGAVQTLVAQTSAASGVGYGIEYKNNGGTMQIMFNRWRHNVTTEAKVVNYTLTVGTWYHLILTYNGSVVEGFINNASQGTQAASGNGSGWTFNEIDIMSWINQYQWVSGLVDEVGFWNKVISSQERADLYNSGNGNTMVNFNSFSSTFSETITQSDSFLRTILRNFLETVTQGDSFLGQKIISKIYSDGITLIDSILRVINKVWTESVTLTDSIVRTTQRAFSETLSSIDSIASKLIMTRGFSEVISLKDKFKAFLNGVSIYWTEKFSKKGDSWSDIDNKKNDNWSDKY